MAAFRKAIEVGADGIEFDVRLSRDGVPVVIHDETLQRTGLRSDYVSCLSAEELQQVNVGKWFGNRRTSPDDYVNETVPTLRQLLDYSSAVDAVLYLELKCRREEASQIASVTCDLLASYQRAEQMIIECFDLPVIQEVKRLAPHLKTAALFQPRILRPHLWSSSNRLIEEAHAVGADEIALHHKLADDLTIESAHAAGLKVVIWTVDDPAWIIRARSLDVHALITNDPATMIQHRNWNLMRSAVKERNEPQI